MPGPHKTPPPAVPSPDSAIPPSAYLVRSYKIHSRVNKAMLRAADEHELLETTCRVIVEEGGFISAWVGYAEQDERKSVRPVAQIGFEDGYLEKMDITWADSERGRGPAGTAIRTQQPAIMRDILDDPNYAPWRAAALERGYVSSIALPLRDDGHVMGVLNIYAGEPDAFDDREVQLLSELARDLAFGILALRARAERERADEARRTAEENYRLIVETANEGIWSMDENDCTTFANAQACKMLGYSAEEMQGKNAREFMFPEDWADHETQIRARHQGIATRYERRYRRKDGSLLWALVSGAPLLDRDNRFGGSFGMLTDITERKQAEEAIQQSERRFSQVFHSSPVGTTITRLEDGFFVDVNEAWLRLFGYTRSEVMGNSSLGLYLWVHPEQRVEMIQRLVSTGSVRGSEYLFRTRTGEPRDILLFAEVIDLNGQSYNLSLVYDITDRKRTEIALRESQDKFAKIFHSSPLPVTITRLSDGRFLDANDAFLKAMGYERSELLGKTVPEVQAWADVGERREAMALLHRDGRLRDFEARYRTKSGEIGHAIFSAEIIELAGEQCILGVSLDISDRKRAEAMLEQRAIEIAALSRIGREVSASLSIDEVVLAALGGVVEAVHPDVALLFLRENDRLVLRGSMPADSRCAHSKTPVHRAGECLCGLAVEKNQALYSSDICRDERCTWIECREAGLRSFAAIPLLYANNVIGVLGVAAYEPHDFKDRATFLETLANEIAISIHNAMLHGQVQKHAGELEQRVAERTAELVVAMGKAQEADRLKSAFLATMSHELRTPLNSIIGFTGLMLQELPGPLNEEQSKQLGMVQSSARHLLALINDVLDISKIEAGQLEVRVAPFDMRETILHICKTCKPLADKKGLTIRSEIADEMGRITSDRRRVEQILINLINNAIKFTEQGEIRVECRLEGQVFATRVIDSGVGIKPEDLDKLFLPFRQIESGLSRRHDGTGLGLVICKRLVERLGGQIWAESEWGVGSVFTFTLPLLVKDLQ